MKIVCDEKFYAIVDQLKNGFHEGFGIPVVLLPFDEHLVQKEQVACYDLLLIDNPALMKHLCDNGVIVETMDFCYATPVLVVRKDVPFSVTNITDFVANSEKNLRLAVASEHLTLSELVRNGLEKNQVKTQGKNVQFQFQNKKQTKSQNLTSLLQQLKNNEIDIVACWDFDLSQILRNSEYTKSFQTIQFPPELDNTVPILIGIAKDCTDYAVCCVFLDFIKSNIGQEIYKNNFQNIDNNSLKE
ncbi:MAG: substrate-binding domain-containing protein [Planctomycetaceae bacterium]|nr:substrate-binding domain-containing protein [Planctomycetaceae bacterium]